MTAQKPLPERMRPDDPDLFLGQSMAAERLPSLLFFGPPGCGKSTLALLLARSRKRPYLRLSAPEAGLQHLRRSLNGIEILVLDELHRFSKAQQDFFLPLVESGELTLLATTTENPSFSVTRQLLSRLHVLRLRPLGRSELMELARRGAEQTGVTLTDEVLDIITAAAHGDARTLLNLVEYAASLPEEMREPEQLKSALPEVMMRHDKDGDSHYELASALIKSIRGSDPDAALYYLACLLEGGEDPRFICRRLLPAGRGIRGHARRLHPAGRDGGLSGPGPQEQQQLRRLSDRRPRSQIQRSAARAPASAQRQYAVAKGMGLRQGIQISPQLP